MARLGEWVVALAVLSALAMILLVVRVELAGVIAFTFLVWNLLLAWIPFLIALAVRLVHLRRGPAALLWALIIGWLLFLPNAPYIVTDLVHLGRIGGAPLWYDAALIGGFAFTGLALGLASLLLVHQVVESRVGRLVGWLVAVGSLGLSALGIYLGRFLRFNSWDVLGAPGRLVRVVTYRLADPLGNPFLLGFGLLTSALLLVAYAMVRLFVRSPVVSEP